MFAYREYTPLRSWLKITEQSKWKNLTEVRQTFNGADAVGRFTVFDIKGNAYRLITAVHYNRQKVFIRHVLTHAEYDRGRWKEV
jgi:mRNA interferase HigB